MSFTFIEGLKTAVKEITPKLIRQAFARGNGKKKSLGKLLPMTKGSLNTFWSFCH